MDIERFINRLEDAIGLFIRTIDWLVITLGACFGAWMVWSIMGDTDATFLMRLAASALGASVCAVLAWLVWTIAKILH